MRYRPYNQSGGSMNNFERIKNMTLDEMAMFLDLIDRFITCVEQYVRANQ